MLPRQKVKSLRPFQTENTHLFHDLLFGHLVHGPDRYRRVLAPIFEEENPAARAQRLINAVDHLKRVRKLVISVNHDCRVDGFGRLIRLIYLTEHPINVFDAVSHFLILYELQHFWLDVY